MWQTPREGVEKNTAAIASDNKCKKEELEDCNCGDQQKQSANSKNQKSTTFGGKLSKDRSVDEGIKDKAVDSVTETTDSGFISGPQSEPIDFEEEEPNTKGATQTKSSQQEADKTDTHDSDEGAVGGGCSKDDVRGLKLIAAEEHVGFTDSGCIEEEYDEENVGAEADAQENYIKLRQVERETSSARVGATEKSAATLTATGDNNSSNAQMKFKQNVDAGVSEWICKSDNQSTNNLNTVSGRRAPMTATNTTSTPIANRQEAGNSANSNRTPAAYPWEKCYKQNDDGDTALHLACIAGYIEVITALIRMAPHPCLFNIQNDDAQTSLHLAALTAQPNVLRVLLLAGAEPTVRDRHGNTALHLACIAGEMQCVRALTEPFAASEIHEAHRQYGHRSNDKALSSLSYARLPSDLEIRNYDGERCVHLAAQGGHIEILRILVSHGADINAREGKSGRTPLHIAIECRNEDLANFLLDECEKLNLETATYAGLTAYQVAQILDNAQMQNILQKRGAEPLTPPDSDYDSSDMEDSDDGKLYDRFGDPRYFANYNGGNRMTVA